MNKVKKEKKEKTMLDKQGILVNQVAKKILSFSPSANIIMLIRTEYGISRWTQTDTYNGIGMLKETENLFLKDLERSKIEQGIK
jgi:hypothetical protein